MNIPSEIHQQNHRLRAFTALTVPASFRNTVKTLPQSNGGRWTHAEDLHITLRYLGPVETSRLPAIQDALSRIRRPAFHIEARGLDIFKNRRQTILFADIPSTRKITTLVAEITDKLAPLGFDFGTRPYVPHITLARYKKSARLDDYIQKHGSAINDSWQAGAFHLVRSGEPDESGKRYRTIDTYPLR